MLIYDNMKLRTYISFLLFLFISFNTNAQIPPKLPGGVSGAEVWYIADHADLDLEQFKNDGTEPIEISSCNTSNLNNGLFNFNHSIDVGGPDADNQLCLKYNAALENTISRNVFFVAELYKKQDIHYSYLTTDWNQILSGLPQVSSETIRNRFDISMNTLYLDEHLGSYTSDNNASVNFYHWNIYNTDRKFKSYGYEGETTFYIGKDFVNTAESINAQGFEGNFPEFISYPFELSANQRNRVESYLALKYGLTLVDEVYRSAKNIVFWNTITNDGQLSNQNFMTHIFGIGRDDISGLNQLQSESYHNQDYLIASVKKLVNTNPEKQQLVSINNENFIVFGDNNQADGLQSANDFNVRTLNRKWLSQNTGDNSSTIPIFFKLNINGVIAQELANNTELKLWMLHDKNVTDQAESNFNSQYVDYYEPVNMDGLQYGFFENVFFDTDDNIYDQFTFGVGPEMIVQVRLPNECEQQTPRPEVVITGGTPPYNINITSTSGADDDYPNQGNTMQFIATNGETYTITVTDSDSSVVNQEQTDITINILPISVDLGNDIVLEESLQEVLLDAGAPGGVTVTDPNATYTWLFNGELLQHYDYTLLASEPGEYTVVITSADGSCEIEDSIILSYNFGGNIIEDIGCDDTVAAFILSTSGGVPPFTTTLVNTSSSDPSEFITIYHNAPTFNSDNQDVNSATIPFGEYNITTIDANLGIVFTQNNVEFKDPLEGMDLDLVSQLEQNCLELDLGLPNPYYYLCSDPSSSYVLSGLVSNPNIFYEWQIIADGGAPTYIYGPKVEIYTPDDNIDPSSIDVTEVTLAITNLDSGCEVIETFWLTRDWRIREIPSQTTSLRPGNNTSVPEEVSDIQPTASLKTTLYPNPSESGTTFHYEISSTEILEGTVEIYSPTGALVHQVTITGKTNYNLPFNLALSSGVYLIATKVNGKVLTEKLIID